MVKGRLFHCCGAHRLLSEALPMIMAASPYKSKESLSVCVCVPQISLQIRIRLI